jgi:hypothetical protein
MKNPLPSSSQELTQAAIKGAVSAIPVVGGLIAELGSCLASPLEKRKRAWCEEVEEALKELAEQHVRLPESLVEDPAFVSVFMKATAAALSTHQEKKRAMLRAFFVAVGSRAIPDEELQHALLRLLEDLSVGHIEVLSFLKADEAAIASKESLEDVFARYDSEHRGRLDRMAFRWILSDLASRMVIHLGDIEDMKEFASQQSSLALESSKVRPLQITELGIQFLELLRTKA